MKRISLLFLMTLILSCDLDTKITEEPFTCPDGLLIPSGIVGTVKDPFQGDILIDQTKQVGVTTALWEDKHIAVYFDSRWNESEIQLIKEGMAEFAEIGFTFEFISEAEAFKANPIDHIFIKYSGIAASHIGKKGGQQEMYLPHGWLSTGTVIHEFGHAVGLHHPHVTEMQDEWLSVYWDNIQEDKKFFFRTYKEYGADKVKQKEGFEYGDEYDIYSVMNYPSNAFAIDLDKPTMTLKDGTWFEPGEILSEGDKISINRMYECKNK